jgi:alcohol dehydrogenase class IV
MARILNPDLNIVSDHIAASESPNVIREFLKKINLSCSLRDKGIPEYEIEALAKQSMVLPDYKSNPKVVDQNEMIDLIRKSY